MKKLLAIIFIVVLLGVLFYNREFGWSGTQMLYAYESECGISVCDFDYGDSKCSCITLDNSQIDDFLKYFDVEIIDEYFIDNIRVCDAYSKYIDKNICVSDKKYNLQIAYADKVLIGCPQLYLGF